MKKHLLGFSFLFLLFLFSCETQEIAISHENRNFKIVSLDEIPKIGADIQQRRNSSSQMRQSATDYLSLIKSDKIIVMTDKNGYNSYTFALDMEEVDQLSNLVIKETQNGLDYTLVKYLSTEIETWKTAIKNNQNPTVAVTIDAEPLDVEPENVESVMCIGTTLAWTCPADIHHLEDANDCTYSGGWYLSIQFFFYPCAGGNTGGNIGGNPTNPGGSGPAVPEPGGGTSPNIADSDDPCQDLKDLGNPLEGGMKPEIDWLKSKLDEPVEYGVEVERTTHSVTGEMTYPKVRKTSQQHSSVLLQVGGNHIGSAHSHGKDILPIPDYGDLKWLLECYEYASAGRKQYAFNIIVGKNIITGSEIVYALKINDIDNLREGIDSVWYSLDYEGLDEDAKLKKILEKEAKEHSLNGNNFEKKFLEKYAGYGIKLFKANDESMNSWSELALDPDTSLVTTTPCN